MQPHARLENLIEYTILAATTLKEIAQSAQVPCLLLTSSLSLMILEFVSASKATKELTIQMIEQIHEILCAIIGLYSSTAMDRILPSEVLYDIATFIETLQKIYTFMKGQQEMGKIKQLFKQGTNAAQLEACKASLQEALTAFRVQIGVSTLSGMAQVRKDVEQQHEELVVLLANLDITRSDSSSVRIGLLPASPQIFHGRESELEGLRGILARDSARIAILGPGGMGKTTLALSLLHEPSTVSKYVHRYFVPCHSTPTCSELVSNIASHIGVAQGRNLAHRIGHHLSLNPPSLLILDNLETPWEPLSSRADVEELLSLLADVSHVAIVITMRGAERPGKVKWTRPCPPPLKPLSDVPALQTFVDIAGESHDKIALSRWKTESTRLLSDGYDKTSSLEISIILSLSSSRMNSEAQKLLSLLSMLPDGLSDADLVQSKLPISSILSSTQSLVPIREYVHNVYPSSPGIRLALRTYFHRTLDLWDQYKHPSPMSSVPQISANLGNLSSIFSDAIQTESSDIVASLHSVILLSNFCRRNIRTRPAVLDLVSEKIEHYRTDPVYGIYLIESLNSTGSFGVMGDMEVRIRLGHQFFETANELERARWHNALGQYYFMRNAHCEAMQHRKSALSLAGPTPTKAGRLALQGIAQVLIGTGDYLGAKLHADQAQQCAISLGDLDGQAHIMALQAICCIGLGHFQQAATLCAQSRQLAKACGLEGGAADYQAQGYEAEICLLRTEYPEARRYHVGLAGSSDVPSVMTAWSYFGVALIDSAIGADPDLIRRNVDIAADQFTTSLAFPMGASLWNPDLARTLLEESFLAMREKLGEGVIECLERLAELSNRIGRHKHHLQWATVFLTWSLKAKNRLATMKALRCLGDIFAAHDEADTALTLFEVALEGFTLMGVHGCRGECMVRMSSIFEKRRNIDQSVSLLRAARPLFERSSQMGKVKCIDLKLVTITSE
ncbi:hypothetical protein B0H13DRAFT_2007882 [Mycena leptocephala]|nr:hypothetical protein B0H13DRAFT_2007882 [Mycena leptocephala]